MSTSRSASRNTSAAPAGAAPGRLASFASWARRGFVAYARWLDSISWRRFIALALLAMIAAGVLSELPPFNIKWGDDRVTARAPRSPLPSTPKSKPSASGASSPKRPALVIGGKPYEIVVDADSVRIGPADRAADGGRSATVMVDRDGVRIRRRGAASVPTEADAAAEAASGPTARDERLAAAEPAIQASAPAAPAERLLAEQRAVIDARRTASAAARAASEAAAAAASGHVASTPSVSIQLSPDADTDEIREAVQEAANGIEEAIRDAADATTPSRSTQRAFRLGDHLPGFMFLLIVLSIVTKLMAAGRFKAEAQAVVATEMAESEALKRQVVEARMAAMQAQVEPHFLFNTLASIDHLIETDPPRASRMQKNLIALLRAAMPSMREANAQGGGTRDLGRELAVIRPFLEILKVRMEERLQTEIRVSDGLLSAEFPPMMLQGLVENAIKHGLEPKAEGGSLLVSAEIVHGKLAVSVADSGVGFAAAQKSAATAGTGIGLRNIRERLQLLYGGKAALTVTDNPAGGTTATLSVPYAMRAAAADANVQKEPA